MMEVEGETRVAAGELTALVGAVFRRVRMDDADADLLAGSLVDADLVSALAYDLDPRENDVRGLRVALPEGAALLRHFGVVVVPG